MIRRDAYPDDSLVARGASRRGFLQALGTVPTITTAASWSGALTALHKSFADDPAILVRSKDGRHLSRVRYHRAESFFALVEGGPRRELNDTLYYAGIVAQLGLSAHLLDVGFPDAWCARFIGLRVAKGLDYANATGFGHDCADMAKLAVVLTPYWVWRHPHSGNGPAPDDGGFTLDRIQPLLRALLDRAHSVTGHPRPNGWRQRHTRGGR